MRRSLKVSLVLGAVTAATALITPAAGAQPANAQDCTTVLIQTLISGSAPELVEVTYTPPATVTVSADGAVAATGPFVTWVDCVV